MKVELQSIASNSLHGSHEHINRIDIAEVPHVKSVETDPLMINEDKNSSSEITQLVSENKTSIASHDVRNCNPDHLFPKVIALSQPLLGIASWLICHFTLFAKLARNQLGLMPDVVFKVHFAPLNLEDVELPGLTSESISIDDFKKAAHLELLPVDSEYFRDTPSSAWAGITNADSRAVLDRCQQDPVLSKFTRNLYESYSNDHPDNANKIAIPCKPEIHIAGRSSSHGIPGHAEIQATTQECLQNIEAGNTPYCFGSTSCQEPLGFDTRGEKTPNPYDATRGCGGSTTSGAALVSAGAAPVALATDAGGSARGPAHHTGVTGFKGGRDQHGNPFLSSKNSAYQNSKLCEPGLIANNIANLVDAVQHMTTVKPDVNSLQFKSSSIAFDTGSLSRIVDDQIRDKCEQAMAIWRNNSDNKHTFHDIDVMSLEGEHGESNALAMLLSHAGSFSAEEISVYDNVLTDEQRANAPASLKANIATARTITQQQLDNFQEIKDAITARLESLYSKGIQFLVLPTGNKVAQPVSWWRRRFDSSNAPHTFQFTQLASYGNVACLPAISVPIGHPKIGDNQHLPTSLTIMSTSNKVNPWDLLGVAGEFENICRHNEALKLQKPSFYIHDQLVTERDTRRERETASRSL
ncbi:MAG: hypothetical protein KAG53_09050 [Endozoicomonadaceae bacterium]|nr:hypothetical protein [Endozoicomonadaceae bacterium]